MEKEVHRERLGYTAFVAVVCLVGIAMMFIISCGEEAEKPLTINTEGAIGTLAKMKVPTEAAPAAPQTQIPEGVPTIKSVGYYGDWQLTKPVEGAVPAGKTIFIQVVFSEGMKLVVADDETARPVLYRRIAGKLTRFRIANFGAKGEDFVSGDAKPVKNQTTYLCKYVVEPGDVGEFVFAVGKLSVDRQNNLLPAFYTHAEKLHLGKPLSPTIKSIEYYSDGGMTKPLTGTVESGTTIYTKIVFSEEMEHVVSDGANARPEIYYRIGDREIQHNIVPFNASGRAYLPGDTKPTKNQMTYLGKYRVETNDYGAFTVVVGESSANKKGVKLTKAYVHAEALQILEPPAPVVTITGAPTGIDNSDSILVNIRGRGATHYKYSVSAGEKCGAYGHPLPIRRHLTADVSGLPDGTVTLCVLGSNIAGIWQTEPTIVRWTRDSSVVPEPPVIPEPVTAGVGVGGSVPIQTGENVQPSVGSFFGTVYVPKPRLKTSARNHAQPLSGVIVTIISGPYSNKSVITNQSGQYLFQGVGANELHLSVEKAGFEPKEVIVSQSNPTTLPDRVRLNFRDDPQNDPGNILMGHVWPEIIRDILRNTVTVPDLLCVHYPLINRGGFYDNGVCAINTSNSPSLFIHVHAHEIAHAHQDAGIGGLREWADTPEGRAFLAAREKDWAEVGKAPYDAHPGFSTRVQENAAETFTYWWSIGRWTSRWNLKRDAPNRLQWAETWFKK